MLEYNNISTGQNTSSIDVNESYIYLHINSTCGGSDCNITSVITSTGAVNITVNNLETIYKGDFSVNITANVYDSSWSLLNSITRKVYWRYSPIAISYPSGIKNYNIYPWGLNVDDVQPFGQKPGSPIYTVSTQAKTDNVDVIVCLNDTLDACLNVKWSLNYNQIPNIGVNGTAGCGSTVDAITALTPTTPIGLYNWWDLNSCTNSGFSTYSSNFIFDSYCADCVRVN